MPNLKALFSTFKIHLSQSFGRATFRFCVLFQPILYSFILYIMYKDSAHINYVNYVVLGSGITSLWSSLCFSSAGDIERERFMGTLENIFCAPVKFTTIVLGKVLANTLLGLSSLFISLAFIKIAFNGTFHVAHLGLFILSFILMIISFICIAMIIAPIFTLSKNARALMNCLEYPVFILCGIVFPIDLLPKWIRPISYILSPTWSTELLRQSSLGITDFSLFYKQIFILLFLCLIYLLISHRLFKKIDTLTRVKATLGVQ